MRVASLSSKACTDPTYRLAVGTQEVMIAQNESRVRLPSNLVDADDWTIEVSSSRAAVLLGSHDTT